MSLKPANDFKIPPEALAVDKPAEVNLVHFEMKQVKPRGTISVPGALRPVKFQFVVGETLSDGIYATLDEPIAGVRPLVEELEKYPRLECLITITLLQSKILMVMPRHTLVAGSQVKTFHFGFPEKFMKMHRRRHIRIPFNEGFPAELRFQMPDERVISRKLRDLSREGMRIKLEAQDQTCFKAGDRLKGATLKVLDKEIPMGLQVVAVYPGPQAGLKIIALSDSDKVWLKDVIRVLMAQLLKLPKAEIEASEKESDEEEAEESKS